MVVNGYRKGPFGLCLTDYVLFKERKNFFGFWQVDVFEDLVDTLSELFVDDFIAKLDTFVANVNAWSGYEFADLLLALSTERALK